MSRREARVEREAKKKLEQQAKSARLVEALPPSKPRRGANPDSIYQMKMSWTCDEPDCEDSWSWGVDRQWSNEDWDGAIHPKLEHWEKLTWGEIDKFSSDAGHKMHHNMDTDVICEEAQMRLIDIERYADTIFRFRLGNKRRLWGYRVVNKFEILWFDPTHGIYPTDPD